MIPTVPNIDADTNMAIQACGLSKTYHLYPQPADRLKQFVLGRWRRYYRQFDALSDVSFSLPKGQVLGVVGRNGAGKSTLLQLICGTVHPSAGELHVHGRIAALLELGAGFNPQFTGRENIFLAAMVMGVGRRDVERKLDDIIDFAGIREFIDQPVSTYSSGMFVRLAFSVATSVDPDILIIDEALSVGDGDFARRSFERIMEMKERGKTILFCSHALYQVEMICNAALWLERGQVKMLGSPADVIPAYQAYLDQLSGLGADENGRAVETQSEQTQPEQAQSEQAQPDQSQPDQSQQQTPPAERDARLTRIHARSSDGQQGPEISVDSGETSLQLAIEFHSSLERDVQVAVVIHSESGQLVSSCGNWVQRVSPQREGQIGRLQVEFGQLPLLKGRYRVGVLLLCDRGVFLHDQVDPVVWLKVQQRNPERGLVMLPHRWSAGAAVKPVESVDPVEPGAAVDPVEPGAAAAATAPAERWPVDTVDTVPLASLWQLHETVFGQPVLPELWRWKYRFADAPGSVVTQAGEPVAFFGAIPRDGYVFGQPTTLVQIGDVMVDPGVRGVLTRKGPFYRAAVHFLIPHVGRGKRYPYAFGFPNLRAGRLGFRLKLYCPVDRILDASWTPLAAVGDGLTGDGFTGDGLTVDGLTVEPLLQGRDGLTWTRQLDTLWQAMLADCGQMALGARDSHWIRHRYLDKPGGGYELLWVSVDGQLQGLLVLKQHPQLGCELIDLVAPRAQVPALITAARVAAGVAGQSRLFAWVTPTTSEWLADTGVSLAETDIIVPGNYDDDPAHAHQLDGRWWMLGGDADFR
jgi:ABC-type polysaccharide/polyol phosphate transport system ATPase subunit